MHVTVLMNVWNSALWLPWSLRACYPFADTLVVTESCWVAGDWVGETSPDGTADIVRRFIDREDPARKLRFRQTGRVADQATGRNSGLSLVPPETDWVFMVDSDEFYRPEDLAAVRHVMAATRADHLLIPARCFYFDFTWCRHEDFHRGWRWFPGQHFVRLADMVVRNGQALALRPLGWEMFHYSYVSPGWTRLKACMGEDVSVEHYRRWWDTVYAQFDGRNLSTLYARNSGGIHVFGGGTIEPYDGPHPAVLDDHPLRHWRWEGESAKDSLPPASRDECEVLGFEVAGVEHDAARRDVLRRVNMHVRNGRYALASRMLTRELGAAVPGGLIDRIDALAAAPLVQESRS